MARFRRLIPALMALAAAIVPAAVHAQTTDATPTPSFFPPSINDWGEHGLLQAPTARFGADGDFNFTFTHVHPYDRYNIYMTPLPWLEAGFRYTDINNRPYGPASFSGNQTYKDRSFDLRVRLSEESEDFPQTSLGIRDIAGTGLFSSEYFVASRRYYNFDVSLGLGWGLMSSGVKLPNIFGAAVKSFKQRAPSTGAGSFQFDYFHGPKMGLFGGIEYRTPIEGVRLKLELDPDDYQNEPLGNVFKTSAPVNFGVVYKPYSFAEMSVGIERGNTLMLRISFLANFNSKGLYLDNSEPPALVPRPNPEPPVGRPLDQSTVPLVPPDERVPRLGPAPSAPIAPRRVAALARAAARPAPPHPAAISAAAGVDRLFDGALRLGYRIGDVSLNDDVATLSVSPPPSRMPGATDALRRLAIANLAGVREAQIVDEAARPLRHDVAVATAVPPPAAAPDQAAIAHRVFADLRAIDFTGERFALVGPHAWLSFSQDKYRLLPVAMGRAARIVAQDSPPEVELITLDALEDGMRVASVTLQRRDLERAVAAAGSPEEIWAHATLAGGDPDRPPGVVNDTLYPNFSWSLNPQMRQELGGPDSFLIYQIFAALSGTLHTAPGQSFDGILGANLFNNLNSLHQVSDSVLPHVRSDINEYLKEGKTGIFRLQSDSFFNLAPNFYGRVSAGLLETMFAGVDAEVLYRPYEQRWAVGLDLNHVAQRGYHELFGLRNYQVTTGHLSLYYKLPFYSLEAALHIGRYLAGDKGATFELSREFAGGIRAGIFFTRTNVSAAQFGEGAFDKGFMISIPIELFFGQPTRSVTSFLYRPLTRDGGQMLDIAKPLYPETDGYDPATLSRMWPHLLD
jgi:hypothetical protein